MTPTRSGKAIYVYIIQRYLIFVFSSETRVGQFYYAIATLVSLWYMAIYAYIYIYVYPKDIKYSYLVVRHEWGNFTMQMPHSWPNGI